MKNARSRLLVTFSADRAAGFTLIEILTTVAIIAILTAVVFPVFGVARGKARQTSCVSNLHQLTTAFLTYAQDYDYTLPYWSYAHSVNPPHGTPGDRTPGHLESIWYAALYSYLRNPAVYACPNANDHSTLRQNHEFGWSKHPGKDGVPAQLLDHPVNYGANEPLTGGNACGDQPCAQAALRQPARTFLIADCYKPLSGGWLPKLNDPSDPAHQYIISRVAYANPPAWCWTNMQACGMAQMHLRQMRPDESPDAEVFDTQARHTSGANLGFADGHVKWLPARHINFDLFMGPVQ